MKDIICAFFEGVVIASLYTLPVIVAIGYEMKNTGKSFKEIINEDD